MRRASFIYRAVHKPVVVKQAGKGERPAEIDGTGRGRIDHLLHLYVQRMQLRRISSEVFTVNRFSGRIQGAERFRNGTAHIFGVSERRPDMRIRFLFVCVRFFFCRVVRVRFFVKAERRGQVEHR